MLQVTADANVTNLIDSIDKVFIWINTDFSWVTDLVVVYGIILNNVNVLTNFLDGPPD